MKKARSPVTCSKCGAIGHNKTSCKAVSEVRGGVSVRQVAPGVSGRDLATLDPPARVTPTPVDVELRVRVTVQVRVETVS